jgi:hypothetical protein
VAFIYDGQLNKSARSALSEVDFGRQRDCYILAAQYRDPQCVRLWSDFERESPAMARLVKADVATDAARSAQAARDLDTVLVKAEAASTRLAPAQQGDLEAARDAGWRGAKAHSRDMAALKKQRKAARKALRSAQKAVRRTAVRPADKAAAGPCDCVSCYSKRVRAELEGRSVVTKAAKKVHRAVPDFSIYAITPESINFAPSIHDPDPARREMAWKGRAA